eukprot:g2022.t1
MVLHRYGDRLYNGLTKTLTVHLENIADGVVSTQGEAFLRELEQKWEDHLKSTQMIRDILMYMDRTYVNQQHKVPVFQLGLNLWYNVVIQRPVVSDRLRSILLDMIYKERVGEIIEKPLIRSITKMLTELGEHVYRSEFEVHFLTDSADFYKKEANEYLRAKDCPDYLRRAECRFLEEEERVRRYLDESSKDAIIGVLRDELISKQMQTLVEMENTGEVALLEGNKYEDLARMYNLFYKVNGGLHLIKTTMAEHVKQCGNQLVNDPELVKDPIGYVLGLLQLREKYEEIIKWSFGDDKGFKNAVNLSFEQFINQNQRSPEFISLFIDDKLKKGHKEYTDKMFDEMLDKVMTIFRFLHEKDIFERYCKLHLSRRLLFGRGVSDPAESSLLIKLKTECGYQFTSKLESMFNDIKMSEDIQKDFREYLHESSIDLGIDFTVRVLTTGSWPLQIPTQCNLPVELQSASDQFQSFYLQTRTGRKLTWQTSMGTVDVSATYGTRKHLLVMSTFQAIIVNLFNDSSQLTFADIVSATGIPSADLKKQLVPMFSSKGKQILLKLTEGKDITDNCVFSVNEDFTSKLYKVKIGTAVLAKDSEPEKMETRAKVEEDRKPQIEAAIVRIMKARRQLDHHSIITEVTRQLAPRFNPNPSMIKKRIESLIERDFIIRDPQDRRLYRYQA